MSVSVSERGNGGVVAHIVAGGKGLEERLSRFRELAAPAEEVQEKARDMMASAEKMMADATKVSNDAAMLMVRAKASHEAAKHNHADLKNWIDELDAIVAEQSASLLSDAAA